MSCGWEGNCKSGATDFSGLSTYRLTAYYVYISTRVQVCGGTSASRDEDGQVDVWR